LIERINSIKKLEQKAREIRFKTVCLAYKARKAHSGPSLSITDILVALYYHKMNIDPKNPQWVERDRFILSKGHGCVSLYVILSEVGYYPAKENLKLRKLDGLVQGHPDMKKTPGIDFTTGSLGNGIGAAVGIAIAIKIDKLKSKVYVLLGDGEMQEGIVWEAAAAAKHYKLDNLIAIVDNNNFQSSGMLTDVCDIYPLKEKWQSFGWKVLEINGHNFNEILPALELAERCDKPCVIIARTIKGKGVSFMENNNAWHQKEYTIEEYEQACKELSIKGGSNIG